MGVSALTFAVAHKLQPIAVADGPDVQVEQRQA